MIDAHLVCPACTVPLDWHDCGPCGGEGWITHDCGEDVCGCLSADDDRMCETCDGYGGWWECPTCHAGYTEVYTEGAV